MQRPCWAEDGLWSVRGLGMAFTAPQSKPTIGFERAANFLIHPSRLMFPPKPCIVEPQKVGYAPWVDRKAVWIAGLPFRDSSDDPHFDALHSRRSRVAVSSLLCRFLTIRTPHLILQIYIQSRDTQKPRAEGAASRENTYGAGSYFCTIHAQ